jgi:hypothetical protein
MTGLDFSENNSNETTAAIFALKVAIFEGSKPAETVLNPLSRATPKGSPDAPPPRAR